MRRRAAKMWGGVGAGIAGLGLACVIFSSLSCGSPVVEYEAYPVYPLRTDPIVVTNPPTQPVRPAEGGKLDEWLMQHNSIGGKVYDPKTLPIEKRNLVSAVVDRLFGTPPAPKIDSADPAVAALKLGEADLAEGSKLYRRHCANCHGMTGDGRGPAGLFVYPHARDFRLGKMKYITSTGGTATPTRSDLATSIRRGVRGTSMPPFQLANADVIERLVSATIHLSLRGEVESKLLLSLLTEESDGTPAELEAEGKRLLDKALKRWAEADRDVLPVPAEPASNDDSIRRGQQLFASVKAGCISCHVNYGQVDAYRFDAWGTASRVANLTEREFRGGSEPGDLFRRLRLGITTVGMPAQTALSDAEVWDLVHFVQVLSTPAKLPEDVRTLIYTPNKKP
ncbi:MAG: cytochrome c [Gemmataceae bacterium]